MQGTAICESAQNRKLCGFGAMLMKACLFIAGQDTGTKKKASSIEDAFLYYILNRLNRE